MIGAAARDLENLLAVNVRHWQVRRELRAPQSCTLGSNGGQEEQDEE